MLALLGVALAQVLGGSGCPGGRLVREIPVARYNPSCCAGESYAWFDDLAQEDIDAMQGGFVTVAPMSDTSIELPPPSYVIDHGMKLHYRDGGNRTRDNATGERHPHLYIEYSNRPADYPPNEPAGAATNYSIGANFNSEIFNAHTSQSSAALFRLYVDECPFPPSSPPPPPVIGAMCEKGYWPLYPTEAEAVRVSPVNASHTHEFNHITYYMPGGFTGATHGEPGTKCDWWTRGLPPATPPSPPSPPPPSPPPPWKMPVATQVILLTLIPSALIVCVVVGCISWHLYYGSKRGAVELKQQTVEQRKTFFKLEGAR